MLQDDIPLNNRKPNSHDSTTDFNSNCKDLQWEQQHMSEAKASLPWRNVGFWQGIAASFWVIGLVAWALWYAITSAVKSDWVEKPAKAHEVQEMHDSMERIEKRVEKVEQRVDGNAAKTDAKLDHITDLLIRGAATGVKDTPK